MTVKYVLLYSYQGCTNVSLLAAVYKQPLAIQQFPVVSESAEGIITVLELF
jgi:hypothetical protein